MDEKQKLLVEYEMLQAQIKEVNTQTEVVSNQLVEMRLVKESLKNLEKEKKDAETLVPLGAGVLSYGKIGDTDKFIVNVGSEVFLEKSAGETKKFIEREIDASNKIIEELKVHSENIQRRLIEIEPQIQKLVAQAQQELIRKNK